MTHVKNLPSIFKNRGLLAYSEVVAKNSQHKDIANSDIQIRRSGIHIPLSPGGDLHDYVPFYFAARSPMLYSIINNGVNQRDIVYFVTDISKIQQSGLPYVFTGVLFPVR